MRVAFTIVFNGLHHLKHCGFIERMASMFDYWAVVEGAAAGNDSTSWCHLPDGCHQHGSSTDGTVEALIEASMIHGNIGLVTNDSGEPWSSKDAMCRAAISDIKGWAAASEAWRGYGKDYLWQVDADEVWDKDDLTAAEFYLSGQGGNCGCFHADYMVGVGLVARGCWGEGNDPVEPLKNAYRRLWAWGGETFDTHEPPALLGGNGREILCPQRFTHYAYYFDQDVRFKEQYYSGHEGIYQKWLNLRTRQDFPIPVSELVSGPWGKTATQIVPISC